LPRESANRMLNSTSSRETDGVAASLRSFIPGHTAFLMANHGAVAYGDSLLDAFLKTETHEHFANICLVADQLGTGNRLDDQSVSQLSQAKARYMTNVR
jgi:L-fuculose-phosphate aldolase